MTMKVNGKSLPGYEIVSTYKDITVINRKSFVTIKNKKINNNNTTLRQRLLDFGTSGSESEGYKSYIQRRSFAPLSTYIFTTVYLRLYVNIYVYILHHTTMRSK